MKKIVPVVASVRFHHLLCASAAVLLAGSAAAAEAGTSVEPAYDSPVPMATTAVTESGTGTAKSDRTVVTPTATATGHLYVSPTGSDSNPGTQARPLKTIARADALARAGYVIHVAPGTYKVAAPSTGSAGIRTVKSGTATARIKFVSDVKWGAKIVFSGTGMAWNSKGAYVDIEGFDISGTGRIGILAEGGKERITKNFVHDLTVSGGCNGGGGAAIDAWGPGGGAVIDSNVVRNIGYKWVAGQTCNTVQGIYVTNQNNTISNNIISGVASVGINSWHGATASTIVNNTVFGSKMGIVIGHGDSGATSAGTSNNYVANNIVYRNAYGITEMGKVGTNNRYPNNLVFDTGRAWLVKGSVSGTVSANPQFVNYQVNGTGDYRLKNTSPAINKGTATRAPKVDIAGVARPRGGAYDIGAYEY
ncbi:choice-of-anchor Q domain-containing protein [Massilia sp.]|uniref:choice-of-anchor Q domain-containing protein n=1 Tax=Massilia sp. TaxID=1882437 RepID=UPI00289A81DB|nr:choice-of-anchor Q domain-containing protein [Massilia sp.]